MVKRFSVLISLVLVAVLLTGCLTPKVNFTISPNPISVKKGQTEVDLVLKVKLSGFSFAYTVESAVVEFFDEDGEAVLEEPIVEELNETIPVFSGVGKDVKLDAISLDAFFQGLDPEYTDVLYDEMLKGKTYSVKITLTGKNPTSNTAMVKFE